MNHELIKEIIPMLKTMGIDINKTIQDFATPENIIGLIDDKLFGEHELKEDEVCFSAIYTKNGDSTYVIPITIGKDFFNPENHSLKYKRILGKFMLDDVIKSIDWNDMINNEY